MNCVAAVPKVAPAAWETPKLTPKNSGRPLARALRRSGPGNRPPPHRPCRYGGLPVTGRKVQRTALPGSRGAGARPFALPRPRFGGAKGLGSVARGRHGKSGRLEPGWRSAPGSGRAGGRYRQLGLVRLLCCLVGRPVFRSAILIGPSHAPSPLSVMRVTTVAAVVSCTGGAVCQARGRVPRRRRCQPEPTPLPRIARTRIHGNVPERG